MKCIRPGLQLIDNVVCTWQGSYTSEIAIIRLPKQNLFNVSASNMPT